MAHKILGIDVGAYSVKVVVATAKLRRVDIDDFVERPIPPGPEPLEARAAQVLRELFVERRLEHDLPYFALPGDALSMRVLEFGFSGLKRLALEKAVGSELESQLPYDLDDMVFDFDDVPHDAEVRRAVAEDAATGDPAFAGGQGTAPAPARLPAPLGTRVLCAATTTDSVKRFLAAIGLAGIEPRSLLAAPTVYARVVTKLAAVGGADPHDAILVVDHGHARTNVCVVKRGRAVYARTLSRGGRHVTQAIAKAWGLSLEQAEQAKLSDGFVASQREPAPSAAWERISGVVRTELAPLVRDLRQTLSACRAQTGVAPRRAVLCGGGGRLRGLTSFLTEELGVPVGSVTADDAARLVGAAAGRGEAADSALVAHGVALEGATGRPLFDLRKGPFAYRADYGFLRAKAAFLAAAALVLIAFGAVNAYAALYKLRKEEGLLADRMRTTTTEIFGQALTASEAEERVLPKKEDSPLPKMTAFDQLVEVSKRIPARDRIKLDVLELDIRPQKVTMKATADSAKSIDDLEKGLKEIECFGEIARGKVSAAGTGEEKQFSLTITTKCM